MSQPVPVKLSVNLNKVALLRNQRDVGYPSVVEAARMVVAAGAHGITVHPRPDERHIRQSDVTELAALIAGWGGAVEYNIEGYPSSGFIALIAAVRPTQVTLVPDAPDQRTSDHGWDLARDGDRLTGWIAALKPSGARISLFMDPEPGAIGTAAAVGADRIELYTGPYGACYDDATGAARQLALLGETADAARAAGLGVNAGHDLTVDNLPALVGRVPDLAEDLTAPHPLPREHVGRAAVRVERDRAVGVEEDHRVAVAPHAVEAVEHEAVVDGPDEAPGRRADVDAGGAGLRPSGDPRGRASGPDLRG